MYIEFIKINMYDVYFLIKHARRLSIQVQLTDVHLMLLYRRNIHRKLSLVQGNCGLKMFEKRSLSRQQKTEQIVSDSFKTSTMRYFLEWNAENDFKYFTEDFFHHI